MKDAKKVIVEASKKYPDAVIGWHGMSRSDNNDAGIRFLAANGDNREIKIGESLTVLNDKAKIQVNRYGFHCSDFRHAHDGYGSDYMQRVELTDVGDIQANIYASRTRKCLGIICSKSLLLQYLANGWRMLLQDLRTKYPDGADLKEVEDVLLEMEATGKVDKEKSNKISKALAFTVAGHHSNENDDPADFDDMDCPMMMMGPFGPMGFHKRNFKNSMKNHHAVSALGKKFLKSILDDRLDDLFQEAHKALSELQEADGVRMIQEKTQTLSKALESFYKGTYPRYIIEKLRNFLGGSSYEVSEYVKAKLSLEKVDALKLFSQDSIPHALEKESEEHIKQLWKNFEDRCTAAAAKSAETGAIVYIL